jgi:choline-sulfatase
MTRPPHILIIMVDQLTGTLFPDGPSDVLHAPHLKALADRSVRFTNTYCASPLCAPSRASFMSGLLPSKTGVYDNAAELVSSIPTFAHHLRRLGYRTVLSGKMHFVGPDQLHGFEERLTTDVYPADFGWTPDWTRPDERIDWWYHNLGSVTDAGTAEITNQLDYDDEVAHHAKAVLYRLAREADKRPFCLTVSFTHPHDPYVARQEFWDLYDESQVPMPTVGPLADADIDPHSRRLMRANDVERFDITEQNVQDSRRAYMANVSYLDSKIGELLDQLAALGLAEETAILFCADHGDMLGERGLWFKMSFFEGSSRVPLMLCRPGPGAARRVDQPVSLLDVLPTLVDLAGGDVDAVAASCDGRSLLPLATGQPDPARVVFAAYAGEGSVAPMVMVREKRFKLNVCPADPPQLFDLENDPHELSNLAGDPAFAADLDRLTAMVEDRFDLARFDADVRASQARRALVYEALRNGHYYPWDFQPLQQASERYMRNHMDLNVLEAEARFPKAQT